MIFWLLIAACCLMALEGAACLIQTMRALRAFERRLIEVERRWRPIQHPALQHEDQFSEVRGDEDDGA